MELARKPTAPPSAPLIASGQEVSLKQWFEVSWFFPEGFKFDKLLETESNYLVFGEDKVYKFFKPSSIALNDALSFELRWREACQELIDQREMLPSSSRLDAANSSVLPEPYLGLRLFRWVDGEPLWDSGNDICEFDINNPPSNADDVCLIQKRLPEDRLLEGVLAKERSLLESELSAAAKCLVDFHKQEQKKAQASFLQEPERQLRAFNKRALERLAAMEELGGLLFDPVFQLAFEELQSIIKRFLELNGNGFFERGEKGLLVDGHGALAADKLCWQHDVGMPVRPFLVDRHPYSERFNSDVLSDLSALSLDLGVKGYGAVAERIEDWYFRLYPEAFDPEMMRFFTAYNAVSLALDEALKLRNSSMFEEVDLQKMEKLIAAAYQTVLGLRNPVVIVVEGMDCLQKRALAEDAGKLLAAFENSKFETDHAEDSVRDSVLGSEHGHLVRKGFSLGRSVVLDVAYLNRKERIELVDLADRYHMLFLLVRCELSKEEKILWQMQSTAQQQERAAKEQAAMNAQRSLLWDEHILGKHIDTLFIEPSIDAPQLAVSVLHHAAAVLRCRARGKETERPLEHRKTELLRDFVKAA